MPPTLDLTRTTHSKVIVSPARLNLRRAASYTHDKGPLSATSSRFNFNHLLFASPPPSPGLPQLITRPRKPSNAPRPSRVFRLTIWLFGVVVVFYIAASSLRRSRLHSAPGPTRPADEYEMIEDDLPDFPTPIMLTDRKGRAKWTVSIPANYDFPLTTREYSDMCAKCREVSSRVNSLHHSISGDHSIAFSRTKFDKHFIDVHEAEDAGFLPGTISIGALLSQQRDDGDLIGSDAGSLVDKPVCESSMTFVLASSDAGLGRTMMLLWMAYATAEADGRPFFIDDTRWAYGKYTNIFAKPPTPDCRPPFRHEMLPCPRQARHLVVTPDTAREVFEGTAADVDEAASLAEKKAMFKLARRGYEALFHINTEDAEHVESRIAAIAAKSEMPSAHGKRGTVVGMHVRRGDRHPFEFQYRDSYIPLNMYAERARELLNATAFPPSRRGRADAELAKAHSLTLLASDDPLVYDADDFAGAARAQERIRLASKAAIQRAGGADRSVLRRFVDETFGWEGGFFAAMFWHLGRPQGLTAAGTGADASASGAPGGVEEARRFPPSAETLRLRSLVGRAYLMDLAVLAGASDAVVCTVSAVGGRLLAVMMGWEKAFERDGWVNIDGEYGWTGVAL
jgi:hypothetical protein